MKPNTQQIFALAAVMATSNMGQTPSELYTAEKLGQQLKEAYDHGRLYNLDTFVSMFVGDLVESDEQYGWFIDEARDWFKDLNKDVKKHGAQFFNEQRRVHPGLTPYFDVVEAAAPALPASTGTDQNEPLTSSGKPRKMSPRSAKGAGSKPKAMKEIIMSKDTKRITHSDKVAKLTSLARNVAGGKGRVSSAMLEKALGKRAARRAVFYARKAGLKVEAVRDGKTVKHYVVTEAKAAA